MKTIILIICCFFTTIGGLSAQPWQLLNSGTNANIFGVNFINPSTGFIACSDGKIKKTYNGGESWNTVFDQAVVLHSIFFVNENVGFAVGAYGRVFKTVNSGLNWSTMSPTSFHLNGVYFIDINTGYIVGDHSLILKTVDGGNTWFNQTAPIIDARLTGIIFSNNKGYISVLDISTNLLITTNAGNLWQDGKIRSGVVVGSGVDFNGQNGYLGGYEYNSSSYNPLIFATVNNGQSWREFSIESKAQIYDIAVCPLNTNKACAVGRYVDDPIYGNQGLIMRTVDGGETWTEEQWSPENLDLRGVCATISDFYVVGYSGIILRTTHTVGISSINNEIPQGYSLSQNYPNPFNPSTRINFSLPKAGNVKLAVYNTAGKEVAILINQSLSAGNYTADFDASNLTSGVYFYTFQSESFKDSKRMVLLK